MTIKVGGATLNQTPIDWENNLANIQAAIQAAKSQQVDILCLPELCITGYGCEDMFLSQWLPAQALSYLPEIVAQTAGITVAVGLPIIYEGKIYNCAVLIHNQQILGVTAKQFMANDGVHYEPRWFTPWPADRQVTINLMGQEVPFGDIIYEVHGIKLAFEICEDAWHATERPAIRHEQKGVQLILNPSASHYAFKKSDLRRNLILGGHGAKFAYVFANLLGNESGRMIFDGEVLIAQQGRLINDNTLLSFQQVNLVTAGLNFDDPNATIPVDKPPYRFNKEEEFTQAVALALFDYLRKCHSQGFVLSLSGGADSTTCAILVDQMMKRGVKELGKTAFLEKMGRSDLKDLPETALNEHVLTCAYQATGNSSSNTFQAAKGLATEVQAKFNHWYIDDEVAAYTQKISQALERPLTWQQDDIALQNIQARARAPIIWMLANIKKALLITTSNRSEGDVGYATMDGDTSGSIAPIAAVDKYFILSWLKWAEHTLGYQSLKKVNALQPTAELRPQNQSQSDETDLMPYKVIKAIEELAIFKRHSPVEVFQALAAEGLEDKALLKEHIAKFFRLWSYNQWKRERLAPSFHLDEFNVDSRTWCRFPILSGSFKKELEALRNL